MFDIEELQLRLDHVAPKPPERPDLAESFTVHTPDGAYVGAITRFRNREAWCAGLVFPGTTQTVTIGQAGALDGALGMITAGLAAAQKITRDIEAAVKAHRDRAAQVEGHPVPYAQVQQTFFPTGDLVDGQPQPWSAARALAGDVEDVAAAMGRRKPPWFGDSSIRPTNGRSVVEASPAPTVTLDLDVPPVGPGSVSDGCPNPWHQTAQLRADTACPECPAGAIAAPALDMATQPVDATPVRIVALAVLDHLWAIDRGSAHDSDALRFHAENVAFMDASILREVALAAGIDTAGL